jgi:HK97 family phage major capsid protein
MNTYEQLVNDFSLVNSQANLIVNRAQAENRAMNPKETAEFDRLLAEGDSLQKEIDRVGQMSQGRRTAAQMPEPQNRAAGGGGRTAGHGSRGDKGGFNNLGDFAQDLAKAGRGQIPPRLMNAAPSEIGTEGVGADGGFSVPPDFRTSIWQKVAGEDSLFARTDQQTTTGNQISIPADENTPWDTSGGIQAYFESEAGELTPSKPRLSLKTIRLNKLTCLIPVSEELLEDAPGLDSYLRKTVSTKFDYMLNLKILHGTGAGEPLGIMHSDCLVSVPKETGQDADSIVVENIFGMYSRLHAASEANSIWLINKNILPQLLALRLQVGVGGSPIFLPSDGAAGRPFNTLLGRPVISNQCCSSLGDKGDIILADMTQYLTAVKGGGIRADVSMHAYFIYDLMAYRFVLRVAGMPWWAAPLTPRVGETQSCFVTLDERA